MAFPLLLPASVPLPHKDGSSSTPAAGDSNHGRDNHAVLLSFLGDGKRLGAARLKQIHSQMLRLGLLSDPYSASCLLAAAVGSSSLDYALQMFDHIPQPNLYSWNILIRAYASSSRPVVALRLFSRLLLHSPHSPDKFTAPFAIKAASQLSALREGTAIHGMVIKSPLLASDVFVLNSLISFYAALGCLDLSRQVFDLIPERDVVSWNSVISAFAQGGCWDEALELFLEMEGQTVKPNEITLVSVLSACAKKGDLAAGKWIHSCVQRSGITPSLMLENAMLDMYAKCGSLESAKLLFDSMETKDAISWTTMLVGYARSEDFAAARAIFDVIPTHDITSWNALISGYEQGGRPKEALDTFHDLLQTDMKPDHVTLVSVLSACSQLGALDLGCWVHAYIRKEEMKLNFHLTTSLIDMYSKCGELDKALDVFNSVYEKDVFVWSAMIGGLAMHGKGRVALDLFSQMQDAKVKPNDVTFTNLLCACSHAGLVHESKLYFSQMLHVHGIAPNLDHYACMVDALGRAGHLEEAREFLENMPICSGVSVWSALLGACAIHKNVTIGEYAYKNLLQLEPRNHGAYVVLSNLYARSGRWNDVVKTRKLMKDNELEKEPGCSAIEVHGVIHEFLVGDISHPLRERIYLKLSEIVLRLKDAGYASNKELVLHDVEEDVKEQSLLIHSEKLAIAFGLISSNPPAPIRITKNLRSCDDCHLFAKLVSSIYKRDIILRDRYRFHHLSGGSCSCLDYW